MPLARPWTAAGWVFLLVAGLTWPLAADVGPGARIAAAACALAALWAAAVRPGPARASFLLLAAAGLAVARTPAPAPAPEVEGWPVRMVVTVLAWHADGPLDGWGQVRIEEEAWEHAAAFAGRAVQVRGAWSEPSAAQPGRRANVEAWLTRERGIERLVRARLEPLPGGAWLPVATLRHHAHARLHAALEPEQAGLAVALLLGEWAELEPALEERYRRLGLLHVLAVSGLHLWLWDALLRGLLRRRCARLRWCLLTLLAALAGFGPAVLRAWTERGRRRVEGGRLWALAMFVEVALLAPERQGLGFLLSYSATGALLTTPQLAHAPPWRRALRASCAGFLGSLPWVVAAQGSVEPWGIVATPLFGVLLPPNILLCALAWFPGGSLVAQPGLEAIATVDAAMAAPFQRLPWTPGDVSAWPLPAALLTSACGLLALRATARRGGARQALLLGALAAMAACVRPPHQPGVLLLPLGHGLGFVVAGEDRSLILDLGSRDRTPRTTVDRVLLPELRQRRWPWPKHSLLTHEDADHAAGLHLFEARGGVERLHVGAGEECTWMDWSPFVVRALGCRAAVAGVRNAAGPVLELRRAKAVQETWRAVVLGDQFGYALRELRARLEPGPVDLLVLPHHGLTTDGLGELLDHLQPRAAWAASGDAPEALPAYPLCQRRGIPLDTPIHGALAWP